MKGSEKTFDKTNKLGNEKISKLMLSFFSTSLVGLLLNSFFNLTDTLFVSWGVGDFAMSGVAIVAPFVLFQGAISTMIGGGAATLVSIKLGDGKISDAGKITVNAMFVFYTVSILTTILGFIFLNPLLKIMGAREEVFAYAKDYFVIVLIGNVFSTGFSAIMRAEGKNIYSMFTWVFSIIINIILDAIFILVFKWGVKGAAWATVIGQFCGFLMAVFFYTKVTSQKFKGAKLEWKTISGILKIGIPSLVQVGSISLVIGLLNYLISKLYSPTSLITFGYISKLIIYATAPLMAIAHALAPIVGFNFGKGNSKRVKESLKISILMAGVYSILIFLVFEIFPNYLMMIFTNSSAVIAEGIIGLRNVAALLLLMPISILLGTQMQAMGNKWWATAIFGANVVFIILPAIFLGKYYGMIGLMWAYVIANLCSTLVAVVKFILDKIEGKKVSILDV